MHLKNKEGNTALSIAVNAGLADCVAILVVLNVMWKLIYRKKQQKQQHYFVIYETFFFSHINFSRHVHICKFLRKMIQAKQKLLLCNQRCCWLLRITTKVSWTCFWYVHCLKCKIWNMCLNDNFFRLIIYIYIYILIIRHSF